ncbi:MAG: AAA family ATPase [Myxococcota bacterium]|nr:AAA family ATPase [Myxococcota bacterium]
MIENNKTGVLILAENASQRSEIISALAGAAHIEIEGSLSAAAELEDATWRLVPDLIIASLDPDPEAVFKCIESLGDRCPRVILCGPAGDSDLILRSMRLGVREYVPLPLSGDELTAVVNRLAFDPRATTDGLDGPILGIIGAKGGVGATMLTCQLGAAFSARGARTTIIDLNLQSGDVALYHDLSPTYGVADLDRENGEIDTVYLQSLIEVHSSGVGLMSAPLHSNAAPTLRPSRLQHALNLIRGFSEAVILDLPTNSNELSLAALELADHVLVVTSLDVPALAHCKLQLRMLERAGIPRASTLIVANKTEQRTSLSEKDIRDFLGRPIDTYIPRDATTVLEALNTGRSVVAISPRSEIAVAVNSLTAEVAKRCGWKERGPKKPKRGISRVKKLILGERYGNP